MLQVAFKKVAEDIPDCPVQGFEINEVITILNHVDVRIVTGDGSKAYHVKVHFASPPPHVGEVLAEEFRKVSIARNSLRADRSSLVKSLTVFLTLLKRKSRGLATST